MPSAYECLLTLEKCTPAFVSHSVTIRRIELDGGDIVSLPYNTHIKKLRDEMTKHRRVTIIIMKRVFIYQVEDDDGGRNEVWSIIRVRVLLLYTNDN